jgi:ABC-type ATPase involved in cell division
MDVLNILEGLNRKGISLIMGTAGAVLINLFVAARFFSP